MHTQGGIKKFIFIFLGSAALLMASGRSGFASGISSSEGVTQAVGIFTQSSANKQRSLGVIGIDATASGADFGTSWESTDLRDFGFVYDETDLSTNITTETIGGFGRSDTHAHESGGGSPFSEVKCADIVSDPAPCLSPGWLTIEGLGMGINGKMRVQKFV